MEQSKIIDTLETYQRASNAPYPTSGKSEARWMMPVPAFSVYCRWRPALSS